jgi:hypothetical protein
MVQMYASPFYERSQGGSVWKRDDVNVVVGVRS